MQTAVALTDQSNHELNLAEIGGTQKCTDEKWNNAAITYWGTTDAVDGKGTQIGYFTHIHGEATATGVRSRARSQRAAP